MLFCSRVPLQRVRFFLFLWLIPRAPNFAEFHARGGGGRLPVMPRDLIPPRGRTLLHGEAGKPTSAVGVASPKAGHGGANGLAFGRRAAATGGTACLAGGVSAAAGLSLGCSAGERRRTAEKRALAGAKAAHAGASGVPGVRAGPGSPGKTRGQPGHFPGRAGQKPGLTGAKRGTWAASRGGYGGRWGGKKAPFCREKGGQRGCAGAKTGGESLRGV